MLSGLALLAVFVAGNAVNTGNLLRFGRGQYLAALRFMERNSEGREVVITSDHDFRNGMLVNYYKRYLERPDSNNSGLSNAERGKIRTNDVIRSGVVNFTSLRPDKPACASDRQLWE